MSQTFSDNGSMLNTRPVHTLDGLGGAAILNLRQFEAGVAPAIDRIPALPGIYSFFRDISLPQNSGDTFFEGLLKELHSEKFSPRSGSINPLYEITLKSKTEIPKTKLEQIRRLSDTKEFQETLSAALGYSILFQAPLYVGKSIDLRRRIKEHLNPESTLSTRFLSAGIEIERTTLLILPTSLQGDNANDSAENAEQDDIQSLIFEEIFSRLFSPLFTLRYG